MHACGSYFLPVRTVILLNLINGTGRVRGPSFRPAWSLNRPVHPLAAVHGIVEGAARAGAAGPRGRVRATLACSALPAPAQ